MPQSWTVQISDEKEKLNFKWDPKWSWRYETMFLLGLLITKVADAFLINSLMIQHIFLRNTSRIGYLFHCFSSNAIQNINETHSKERVTRQLFGWKNRSKRGRENLDLLSSQFENIKFFSLMSENVYWRRKSIWSCAEIYNMIFHFWFCP